MKSGKQHRTEIKGKRARREAKRASSKGEQRKTEPPFRPVPVNVDLLAPYKSYGAPAFVYRGYYVDVPFLCKGCGTQQVWTGTQQKWWYEVAKGYVYSTAKLCRPCRRREQARRAEARRVHLEGVARKKRSDA